MQAATKTLKDILAGEHRYVVPPYQRPYVWEQDRQWAPLWADVQESIKRLAEGRQDASAKGKSSSTADEHTAPHFLGAIVLDQLPTPAGEIDRRAVVDGQQRLTTIQLMLRGVLDALDAIPDSPSNLRSQLAKLVYNDDDVVTSPEGQYKVWPRRAERPFFEAAMAPEAPDAASGRFAAARNYFATQAIDWLKHADSPTDPFVADVTPGRVGLLVATLRAMLKLVVIDLEDEDDAQVIFEVLNARHTPLTASDLVKNLLFMRAEIEGLNVEELYEAHWAGFDDPWWAETVGIGHATRARQDWLLGDWLVARSAKAVSVTHLYGAVKSWISASGEKVPDILESIASYAAAYRTMAGVEGGDATRAERAAFSRLQTLNIVAANPLILWLLTQPSDVLAPGDRQRAIDAIDSYLIRRMAVKWQTRAYGTVFVDVLRAAKNATDHATAITERLTEGPAGGYHWPTDEQVATSFKTARAYGSGGMSQGRLRMLLSAVDNRLQAHNTKAEDVAITYENLTIEHLMPQSWKEHWPLPETADGEIAKINRDQAVQRMGNLTLLTKALNPAVSNGSWAAKKLAIAKDSVLQLNKLVSDTETWDEQVIDERSTWLAQEVCAIWRRPAVIDETPVDDVHDEDPNADLLTEEQLQALHVTLWNRGSEGDDGQAWRTVSDGQAFVLAGADQPGAASIEPRVWTDALQRLIANGMVELAESQNERDILIRPLVTEG